ncbi:MAG TPA: hypothetical protein VG604_05095 [Candidatus Saccharimonadales bacterium]|nr:hypothetical protein [Candidatus Saccharimonadales bacterium]
MTEPVLERFSGDWSSPPAVQTERPLPDADALIVLGSVAGLLQSLKTEDFHEGTPGCMRSTVKYGWGRYAKRLDLTVFGVLNQNHFLEFVDDDGAPVKADVEPIDYSSLTWIMRGRDFGVVNHPGGAPEILPARPEDIRKKHHGSADEGPKTWSEIRSSLKKLPKAVARNRIKVAEKPEHHMPFKLELD